MAKGQFVAYEWDVEVMDGDEIQDHLHQNSFKDCIPYFGSPIYDIVLVCDEDNGRSWAYIENGKLPEYFEDACFNKVRKVPKRFHDEVGKGLK